MLHIPRSYLQNIGIFHHRLEMLNSYNFGHYRKTCLLSCLSKKFKALFAQSLKTVRTRTRLERSTTKTDTTRLLRSFRNSK